VANRSGEWSQSEIAYLRAHYGKVCSTLIGETLGRGRNSVIGKARKIGIAKTRPRVIRHKRPRAPLGGVVEVPAEQVLSASPLPVPLAMRRLAEFDPVVRRAMFDRAAGLLAPSRVREDTVDITHFPMRPRRYG